MSYLDLVEDYPKERQMTQFERILLAAKRAKDIHDHNKASLVDNHLTAPYLALQELQYGMIELAYSEEEPVDQIAVDDDSDDDDE